MQKISLVVLIVLLVLSLAAAPKAAAEVTLTAAQVTSALDIEAAIARATANGTRPGTVSLDASAGDFVYEDGADQSIDILYSDVTLTSPNGAVLANCRDGVVLGARLSGLTLAGLTFHCAGYGVMAYWAEAVSNVTIRNNTFITYAVGINLANGADWKIVDNTLNVGDPFAQVVNLINTSNSKVMNNTLIGGTGVTLFQSSGNQVQGNAIFAPLAGVYFNDAHDNQVVNNDLNGIYIEGFFPFFALQVYANTTGNNIVNNTVTCAPQTECTLYFNADADFMETNHINNNGG